jgi:hypothetical protein
MNLNYDVVVAGGGTAGSAAAVAAARRGHKVLLVEESNCLGGVSTGGGVSEWYASLDGLGDIFTRTVQEVDHYGAKFDRWFNSEYLKLAWQLMAQEAGVEILFHASVCGATAHGGRVETVQIMASGEMFEVQAKFFVDASGEGDLSFRAGAAFDKGHPQLGRTLHMSLTCMLFDTGKPVTPYLPPGLKTITSIDELPGLHGGLELPDGRVYCNMTKVMGEDATDPFSLSRAESQARLQMIRVVHFLQCTRFPNHALGSSGARIGIREGRRIRGDYTLTEADILNPQGTDFPDGIAVATCHIDFHSLTQAGHGGWREYVHPYSIPLRALTPQGFSNLLTAGKCISGDQVAHSSYRMTPTCCAMGQAAGTVVALALERGASNVRDVPIGEIRAQLSRDGMELDPRQHTAFAPELSPDATRGA